MLRIGVIDYLNMQPFQYNLEAMLAPRGVTFQKGVPTALNRALLAGDVDLAPISAYFAAAHADRFAILPNHSISSLGAVKTVLLFSWAPDIRELDGARIMLTNHSATSVNLLRVLCRERYGIQPEFVTAPQDLPAMLRQAEAALVIGDDALVEGHYGRPLLPQDGREARPVIFDLGDEWLKLTGLPFTFAVWAARREAVPALYESGVPAALAASKAAGKAHIDEIAAAYAPRLALPAGVCRRYLRDLRYDLTDSDRAGLFTFLNMALPDFDPARLHFLDEPVLTESEQVLATN